MTIHKSIPIFYILLVSRRIVFTNAIIISLNSNVNCNNIRRYTFTNKFSEHRKDQGGTPKMNNPCFFYNK